MGRSPCLIIITSSSTLTQRRITIQHTRVNERNEHWLLVSILHVSFVYFEHHFSLLGYFISNTNDGKATSVVYDFRDGGDGDDDDDGVDDDER